MLLNGYRVRKYNESKWIMIFHQKYPSGGLFNDRECLKSLKKNKFSVIGSVNESFKIDSKYHFLIEYPETGDLIEWEQSKEITHKASVDAFHYNKTFAGFRGLGFSFDTNKSCFDGSPGDNGYESWWYSIGTKQAYITNKAIPGPVFSSYNVPVNEVSLWIKFEDVFIFEKLPKLKMFCTMNVKRMNSFYFLFFVFLLLC